MPTNATAITIMVFGLEHSAFNTLFATGILSYLAGGLTAAVTLFVALESSKPRSGKQRRRIRWPIKRRPTTDV
jgi:hypothetical protein